MFHVDIFLNFETDCMLVVSSEDVFDTHMIYYSKISINCSEHTVHCSFELS